MLVSEVKVSLAYEQPAKHITNTKSERTRFDCSMILKLHAQDWHLNALAIGFDEQMKHSELAAKRSLQRSAPTLYGGRDELNQCRHLCGNYSEI